MYQASTSYKSKNEINSWRDLVIKKSELDVQSHSNRPSTSKESNGTKNGDPHNDSNIPPASTAAVAETTE